MLELNLHVPWFLLSMQTLDAEVPGSTRLRTLCIAWERDLADVLRASEDDRVTGVVCMMPAWASPTGQWSSRVVCEVWTCSSASGEGVLLVDADGAEFDCGLLPAHVESVKKHLVLRVAPIPSAQHGDN